MALQFWKHVTEDTTIDHAVREIGGRAHRNIEGLGYRLV